MLMEDNIAEADKEVEDFYDWFVANGGMKAYDLKKWVEMGIIEQVENVSEISPSGMYLALGNEQILETGYLCQYVAHGFKSNWGGERIEQLGNNNHRWISWRGLERDYSQAKIEHYQRFAYDSMRGRFTGWANKTFYKINNFKKITKHEFMNWNSNPFND
tara:strand:- start:509 stop:988 length:480 start_codon:yes stop_codon:yes gene_type:complete